MRPSGGNARIVGAAYLLALFVLIANDHVFKDVYAGVVTGKLSDFAGLFAFAVFAGAIMPQRARAICCAVGVFFIVWKSPLSQPLIDLSNATFALQIQRVVDYSDLVALVVLPAAARAAEGARRAAERVPAVLVVLLSLFAFAGTSVIRYSAAVPPDLRRLPVADSRPVEEIVNQLESCGYAARVFPASAEGASDTGIWVSMRTRSTNPKREIHVYGVVQQVDAGVTIEFQTIQILRQKTPTAVDPYAAEAIREVRRCLETRPAS